MTRRKAPRQLAPQTIEQAVAAIADYADLLLGIEELQADADASIAAIKATRDHMVAPLEQRARDLFLQLRAWWGVAAPELTDGKRKSVELAGCLLGERTTPPSLKLPTPATEAPLRLINAGLAELCRHKVEVDKPAVLKLLASLDALQAAIPDAAPDEQAEIAAQLRVIMTVTTLGFQAVQKEEFFIDRAGEKPAVVELVQEVAA